MPHDIRLAGPWEYSTDGGSTWDRCSLPFDAASQRNLTAGAVVNIRRRFHRPSGLERTSIVSIIVVADHAVDQIALNDRSIPAISTESATERPSFILSQFRVSALLSEFNTLQLALAGKTRNQASTVDSTSLRIVDD